MKKIATKGYYLFLVVILSFSAGLTANAQYAGANFETGGLYTAMAKDAANDLFVTRVTPGTSGATYEVEEYTNGSGTPAVIYTGLTHEAEDFPWGLAVTSAGNVFISTDFTSSAGAIIELVKSGGTYTPSTYQTGRYFTALAVDANDNLYDTEYDATHLTYAVVKYPANSASGTAGTNLYDNLKAGAGYAYPTGLVIAPNGDVYVADAFSNDPSITDGGHIYKLTAASSYSVSTISTGNYSSALALGAGGNLYSIENRGSGYSLIRYAHATGAGVPVFSPLHTNGIYYPWGIVIYSSTNIYLVDGDDGTTGGAIIKLSPAPPTVTTNAATLITSTGATLNGVVNDNDNTTTVNFIYGTSPTLSGAVTQPATTGGTINAGSGNTAVALTATGLSASTTYYYEASATNSGGVVNGAILNFLTTPSISYSSPKAFNSGVTISPFSPTSSAVPAPAYGSPVAIGSGFATPFGVAADVSGNVYVADYGNEQIKEIPAGGGAPITLLSGFTTGIGVAVDAAGNIYVADAGNTTINEYLAGTTTPVALATGFTSPYGIAVDTKGNVYVADYGNSAVDEIPAGGGTPVAIGSGFLNPTGVSVDIAGNVYVADYGNGLVKEILVNGGSTIALGSGFTRPVGVNIDPAGNIFVADYGASAVFEIPAGLSTPITVGSGYTNPAGVAVDGFGKLTVANYLSAVEANDVEQLTPVGGYYLSTPLPVGLIFNGTTGVISGKPTTITPAANYKITAYNTSGGTSAVVNIKVIANANLSSLKISNGVLSPTFASGTTSYTTSVANSVSTITVTPSTADANAMVTVNGTAVTSGTASGAIALAEGAQTVITTVVRAQDGTTTKTYTVTVTRAPSSQAYLANMTIKTATLSPAFAFNTYSYTSSVANSVSSVTVTPSLIDVNGTITVNGTTVANKQASDPITLAIGQNTINVVVTAQDGVSTHTYTVIITRISNIATLSALILSTGTLSPVFASATTSYTTSVANSVSTMTVTPTTTDANATITVNGTAVTSGTASGAIALAEGAQTVITTVVTAQDGTTTQTYTVTVTRAPSSQANLANMTVKTATLNPAFAFNTYSYTSSVANSVSSVTVTPSLIDVNGTVTVNGTTVVNKQASGAIALAEGAQTVITVVVTAQDGVSTHTYTVTITRATSNDASLANLATSSGTLTPAFATATTSYTASVANSVSTITVTPTTTDANATITVNGTAVTSGTASGAIALAEGAQTVITTVVTAQNGTTTKTYTVTVTRAPSSQANLANMTIKTATLSPAFAFNTYSYTSSVANSVSSVTVTPSLIDVNGTITVNGTAVGNKQASGAIPLAVGQNTIYVVVTAQDGVSTHTYTVTITRISNIATLSALNISAGTLSPVFASGTTSYTTSVANSVSTITVTPTTTDANATITVNGTAVTSGTASGAIALAEGAQTVITTVVTAQDGTTTQTYTLTVTRAPSSQANLANMTIKTATLSPAFAFNTYSYTSSVANSVSSVTVTPSLIDVNGAITVNGAPVGNKQASGPITLAVGPNTINVIVTAQDGTTTKTYTVTITRASSVSDSYDPGISVTKPAETPSLDDDIIVVHQGISPNGDGINDFLVIDGIQAYPDNKLTIMNRNGQLVYETSGYDNSSKVFDGHSNKNGQMQLPGTYFYQLDYTVAGTTKHKTGFIVLKY